jgi:hypothetical protein
MISSVCKAICRERGARRIASISLGRRSISATLETDTRKGSSVFDRSTYLISVGSKLPDCGVASKV